MPTLAKVNVIESQSLTDVLEEVKLFCAGLRSTDTPYEPTRVLIEQYSGERGVDWRAIILREVIG